MTPKEKAEELFDKMLNEHPSLMGAHDMAKQCALIAVDEIKSLNWKTQEDAYYWYAVKKEIEKL